MATDHLEVAQDSETRASVAEIGLVPATEVGVKADWQHRGPVAAVLAARERAAQHCRCEA